MNEDHDGERRSKGGWNVDIELELVAVGNQICQVAEAAHHVVARDRVDDALVFTERA